MKKRWVLIISLLFVLCLPFSAAADGGKVIYSENAGEFVFESGSKQSPTDLFENFKGVMPGDRLTQKITVRNDASNEVKVKIYLRSLGAHEDSVTFLSQLRLRVQKSEKNEMPYMFDAHADETAELTDWILLGTLYSGGTVNLDVLLDVPVELDNAYSNRIGYLDWEFKVEEFPIEDTDPKPPQTGERSRSGLLIAVMLVAVAIMFVLVFCGRKKRDDEE